jgi:hypothetical protein
MNEISFALLDHAGKLRLEILVHTSVFGSIIDGSIYFGFVQIMGVRQGGAYISMLLAIRVAS